MVEFLRNPGLLTFFFARDLDFGTRQPYLDRGSGTFIYAFQ